VQPYSSAYAVVRDPTDVIGRRIGALAIDWTIALAIFVVLLLTLADRDEYPTVTRAEDACERINDVADEFCVPVDDTVFVYTWGEFAAIWLVPLGYSFLADAVLTGITGFSPGKGLVGLRVIRQSDGRRCGFGRSLVRWALWIADLAPYCIPGIVGLVTGLTTKGHRRVGDMAAGTLVVHKHDVGVVPVVPGLNAMAPPPWAPTAGGAPPPAWGQPQAPPPPSWGQPQAPPSWGPPAQGAPPSWGPPAQSPPPAPTWGAPPPPPVADAPPAPPAIPMPSNPGVDSPLWDDARDTYIQWDPDLAAWVQWDEHTREWRPIT
jgi:hypothetical protein